MMLRRALLGLLFLPLASATYACSFEIKIGVHPSTPLGFDRAKSILDKMYFELWDACGPVSFPNARLTELPADLNANIDSKNTEVFAQYLDANASINVVSNIDVCGTPPKSGRYLGCAREGGPIFVVQRSQFAQDAQVWAHEIGHAQGLIAGFPGYHNSHNTSWGSLMFPKANSSNWKLNQSECQQYYTEQNFPPFNNGGDANLSPKPDSGLVSPASALDRIDELLLAQWVHGVDFDIIAQFDGAVEERALSRLSEFDTEFLPVAVIVAGYSQYDEASKLIAEVLISEELVEQANNAEALGLHLNEAKSNSGFGLGFRAFQGDGYAAEMIHYLLSKDRILEIPLAQETRNPSVTRRSIALSLLVGATLGSFEFEYLNQTLQNIVDQARDEGSFQGIEHEVIDQILGMFEETSGRSLVELLKHEGN